MPNSTTIVPQLSELTAYRSGYFQDPFPDNPRITLPCIKSLMSALLKRSNSRPATSNSIRNLSESCESIPWNKVNKGRSGRKKHSKGLKKNDQGVPRTEPRRAYCLPEVLVWPSQQRTFPAIGLKTGHMWSLSSLRAQNQIIQQLRIQIVMWGDVVWQHVRCDGMHVSFFHIFSCIAHCHANQTWDQQRAQEVGDRNVWIYHRDIYDPDRFCQNAVASATLTLQFMELRKTSCNISELYIPVSSTLELPCSWSHRHELLLRRHSPGSETLWGPEFGDLSALSGKMWNDVTLINFPPDVLDDDWKQTSPILTQHTTTHALQPSEKLYKASWAMQVNS